MCTKNKTLCYKYYIIKYKTCINYMLNKCCDQRTEVMVLMNLI